MKTIVLSGGTEEQTIELLEYEFEGLLQALRRDLRMEQRKQAKTVEERLEHGLNARMDVRLLEVLKPKANELPAGALLAASANDASAASAVAASAGG